MWPVGLVGGLMAERPICICDNVTNKVIDFNAAWKPDRPFPLDMAGFAVNLELLLKHNDAWFSYDVQGGYQESEILRQIVTRDQLEPLADCCMKVRIVDPPDVSRSRQVLVKRAILRTILRVPGIRVAHANGTSSIERRTDADQERQTFQCRHRGVKQAEMLIANSRNFVQTLRPIPWGNQ